MSEIKCGRSVPRVLRLKQVQERLGLGRSTIYDRMNLKSPRYDSTFPRPIKLGVTAVGWLEADINSWIDARIAAGWCSTPDVSSHGERNRCRKNHEIQECNAGVEQ